MNSLKRVLSKIIHGQNDFCCLCLQDINPIDDSFIGVKNDKEMSDIFSFIFDEETVNTISSVGAICNNCNRRILTCYRFMKMCKVNSQNLNNAVNSATNSFENTIEDIVLFNSLYMSINTNDFTSQQYYDSMKPVYTTKGAVKRFRSLRVPKIWSFDESIKSKIKLEGTDTFRSMKKKRVKGEIIKYDIPSIPTSSLVCDIKFKDIQCIGCHKIFRDPNKLRVHYFKTHYPRDVKCTKCPKAFISEQFLTRHINEYHNSWVCSECGKHFSNKFVLRKHEINHNTKICCQECGRVYSSKEAYKKHKTDMVCQQKMRKSSDQAEYECDICKKRYCYKPYLAKHIKYEHGKAEGFKCKFCYKTFYNRSNLLTHVVKHTREKKFECLICNGRFGTRAALLYHTRLHTGEKPYQCEHCDRAFLSASRRLDHVRRHHMAPTLECDICHTKFKATGSLLKHKKRHFNPNSRLNQVLIKHDDFN